MQGQQHAARQPAIVQFARATLNSEARQRPLYSA